MRPNSNSNNNNNRHPLNVGLKYHKKENTISIRLSVAVNRIFPRLHRNIVKMN